MRTVIRTNVHGVIHKHSIPEPFDGLLHYAQMDGSKWAIKRLKDMNKAHRLREFEKKEENKLLA